MNRPARHGHPVRETVPVPAVGPVEQGPPADRGDYGLLRLATVSIPVLTPAFKTGPLAAWELAQVLGLTSIVFNAVETEKYFKRRNS